ncbi:MAG: STAS domain-containing protein [Halothiobacillaceae bacterium]|nr:STAS domain-containing protein [Halothiobacillaceae bacterium]
MTFQSVITMKEGVHHILLTGRVDSATAGEFEQTLKSLFDTEGSKVILNFAGLNYISSAGLRVVLMAAKRAKQNQGRLVLCGLLPHVREVFEISGFLKILEVIGDCEQALSLLKA